MSSRRTITADDCCQKLNWTDLDLAPIHSLIDLSRAEDLEGSGLVPKPAACGDHTSNLLPSDQIITTNARARQELTICGVEIAREVLARYDSEIIYTPNCSDGDTLAKGDSIAEIKGPARSLLTAERPVLNFLQRLSGISTLTKRYVLELEGSNTRLLDTRKTTPGYRYLEKFAVACGGGWNHRMGLFDRIMLKDNHIASFGDNAMAATQAAVSASRAANPHLLIEMEVDRIDQIPIALAAEVDIILLDNFSPKDLKTAKEMIGTQAVTEISGGVTIEFLPILKDLGHDFISTGATVHQSVWLDIGLD
ncbi:carboxylating nicotinate-nucleotide diphosphorylase [Puniceicoccaceae bacterium K14]|nr:carboxylating nicotinate-nucleotide diphosphorylase [Puniceicoccaceae bacterium K14]